MYETYHTAYPNSNDFFQLTLKLYNLKLQAFYNRSVEDYNNNMTISYYAALVQRSEKPPPLEDFLIGVKVKELTQEQSDIMLREALKTYTAQVRHYESLNKS